MRSPRLCSWLPCLLAGAFSLLPGRELSAQSPAAAAGSVTGVVRDSAGAGIVAAQVFIAGTALATQTDEAGNFRLGGVPAGAATLIVRRLGFSPVARQVLVVPPAVPALSIVLAPLAQALSTVVVTERGRRYRGNLAEFYRRRDQGFGRFFTQEEIQRRNPMRITDLFRTVPGIEMREDIFGQRTLRMRGARCDPLVWIDGYPLATGYLDPDTFDPSTYAAIEVYTGISTVPVELRGPNGLGACGVIALWSRLDDPPGRGKKVSAKKLAALVASATLYTADQVDVPAAMDTARPVTPAYPEALYREGTAGTAVVEFVVDTTGEVEQGTVGVVSATHPAFGQAAARAVPDASFRPALLDGHRVRQVVRLPIRFQVARGSR